MITQQDKIFYDHCRKAKTTILSTWSKHYEEEKYKYRQWEILNVQQKYSIKVFSGRLNKLSHRYPILLQDIVQSVYDRHMDIMYLYEIFIAQKNKCTLEQATQIATLKRHSRHNYNNINHKDFQQENYDLPVDY